MVPHVAVVIPNGDVAGWNHLRRIPDSPDGNVNEAVVGTPRTATSQAADPAEST